MSEIAAANVAVLMYRPVCVAAVYGVKAVTVCQVECCSPFAAQTELATREQLLPFGCIDPCVFLPCTRGQSSSCGHVRGRGLLCRNAVEAGATVVDAKVRGTRKDVRYS